MWQRNGDGQQSKTSHNEVAGFLGSSGSVRGTLAYEGSMRIDGRMEGEIITDGSLVVGEGGIVRADIKAGVVVCGGTIEGNVIAKERVQLLAPSTMTGMVRTPLLIIEEGAQFNGTCEMKERHAQPDTTLHATTPHTKAEESHVKTSHG